MNRDKNSPHYVPFNSITVLVIADDGNPIPSFTEICQKMAADLELGLVESGVAMCGTFNEAELSSVGCIRGVDVDRECD